MRSDDKDDRGRHCIETHRSQAAQLGRRDANVLCGVAQSSLCENFTRRLHHSNTTIFLSALPTSVNDFDNLFIGKLVKETVCGNDEELV